jgi:hypothetical protein
VLAVHQLDDRLVVALAAVDQLGVAGAAGRQDLSADVDQALDQGVSGPLVLGLDVEDHVVVANVGVVPGDHPVVRGRGTGRNPKILRAAPGTVKNPDSGWTVRPARATIAARALSGCASAPFHVPNRPEES